MLNRDLDGLRLDFDRLGGRSRGKDLMKGGHQALARMVLESVAERFEGTELAGRANDILRDARN